jgi:hypothetical protein
MAEILKSVIAVIAIGIGENSFHGVGLDADIETGDGGWDRAL